MALIALICDTDGNSKGIPITEVISCSCVPESLDQFPSHTLSVSGSSRREVGNINVLDTIKIIDLSIGNASSGGVIAWGVILDPRQQINDTGDTIDITLADITEQTRWTDTGLGWVAANSLQVITQRLGSLRANWSARFTDTTGSVLSSSPVQWKLVGGPVGTTPDGNTVQKTGAAFAWDSEMVGTQYGVLPGPVSFTFRAVELTTSRMAGLTNGLRVGSYPDVTWGVFLAGNVAVPLGTVVPTTAVALVFESGVAVPGAATTFQTGDYFTVVAQNGAVQYYKNGVLFYTSTVAPSGNLTPIAVVFTPQGTIDNGVFSALTTPDQAWWSVRYEKEVVLGALNQLSQNTGRHLRTGRDAFGQPVRQFEVGSFGDISPIRLLSPDGFVSRMGANPNVRIITEIARVTDGKSLTNAVTPLGASTGDAQVDLEYAWRMLFDAPGVTSTLGFKYWRGNFPANMTPFPEYDEFYPISRHATLDGRYQYDVTTTKTDIPAGQVMWSKFEDSQFSYVDTTDANRMVTARALYVAAKAKLIWDAFIHETITLKTVGSGRPPRAGQKVWVQYNRTNSDRKGAFAEFSVQGYYYVMRVTRTYDTTGKAIDDYVLTKNGKWQETQGSSAAAAERQLTAVQMVPRTNIAAMPIFYGPREIATGDATHDFSVVVPVHLPPQTFRIFSANLYVDFLRHRSTVITAGTINEGTNVGLYSTYTGTPYSASVSGSAGQVANVGALSNANSGLTSAMFGGGPAGNGFTGTLVNLANTGTFTGGVLGNPYGGNATSGVLVNPYGGATTSGSSRPTASAADVSYSGGTATPSPGVTVASDNVNLAIQDAIRTHTHTIAVTNGGPVDFTNVHNGVLFGFGGPYGLQANGAGGTISMSFPGTWTGSSAHTHAGSTTGSVNLGHSTAIDGTHQMPHGHEQPNIHDYNHIQLIDHFHLFPHTHNYDHIHYIDHSHSFPHTHVMVPGIFESQTPFTIQVWIDDGSGVFVDKSPFLYDKKSGTYGPFKDSFEIEDISQYVNFPGRVVRIKLVSIASADQSNPIGLGAVFVHGTWLVELSGVASIVFAS